MLIISDFRDYYDTAAAHGVDKTVVFNRKTVETGKLPYPQRGRVQRRGKEWEFLPFVLGFCGELFPGVTITDPETQDVRIIYSHTALCENLRDLGFKDRKSWYFMGSVLDMLCDKDRTTHFDTQTHHRLKSKFQDHKAPFWVARGENLIISPNLKSWEFQRIKDPYTAFQEIHMYISGVLGVSGKPTVQISDKDLASKRGHDGKYSFRKPPGGGRWR